MTAHLIGFLRAIKDPDRMAAYRAVAVDALAKHGGSIVVPPSPPERIEGDAEAPNAFVLLSFPTAEAARAWRDDPALAPVHAMRHAGADISFFMVSKAG
ncbi:MAG: DUF1330 domain-containing protein [Alphaproteobacteria bacterium]